MLLGVRRLRLQRKRRPFEPRVQSSQGKSRRVEIRFRFSILLLERIFFYKLCLQGTQIGLNWVNWVCSRPGM
jgi:hypothetical protein